MGGSGGSYFTADPEVIKKRLRDSDQRTESRANDAKIDACLSSMLPKINDRNTEAINLHLEEIRKALGKELDGTVDLLFGGSVAKHTYVDGLSDIDSLVILNDSELANKSPEVVKDYFVQRLQERFPKTEIEVGRLAVTLRFADAEIQLLPAVKEKSGLKIADQTGSSWAKINPDGFRNALTKINEHNGRSVVPVIKLAKAIISNLPDKHHISGYHAESLAVEIFRGYKGELKSKEMLKEYFASSAQKVLQPIKDRTGQSVHVDDYLGTPNSLERKIISDAFGRVSRRMNNADISGSVDEWKKLFGD